MPLDYRRVISQNSSSFKLIREFLTSGHALVNENERVPLKKLPGFWTQPHDPQMTRAISQRPLASSAISLMRLCRNAK
jgi:hypothetical protein